MKVIVDEQLVNYQAEGSGKTLLLLHGWGTNLQTFDALAQHLMQKYRVVRLDLPGFGGSPKPGNDWSVGDYAKFISKFLRKIEVNNVYTIMAHSFGGRVTIKAVSKGYIHPDKIILMGSAGIKPAVSTRQSLYKLAAKMGKQVTRLPGLRRIQAKLRRRLYASAGAADYLDSGDMKQIFLRTIAEDLQSDAAQINAPTLLLWGQEDTETPVLDAEKFHKIIKHSQLIIIPSAGHFVYSDASDQVNHTLDEFLS